MRNTPNPNTTEDRHETESSPPQRPSASRPAPKLADFRILPSSPLDLSAFRAKLSHTKNSPYKLALQSLADAKRGSVLEVDRLKAYPSFRKAAEKLGYECHYATQGEKLYIQILATGDDK